METFEVRLRRLGKGWRLRKRNQLKALRKASAGARLGHCCNWLSVEKRAQIWLCFRKVKLYLS